VLGRGVLFEPPSDPKLEPELPLEPEIPLDLELSLEPDVALDPELPVPPLDSELDDSLVSPAASASGDHLVEMPPLGPQAETGTEAAARIKRMRALIRGTPHGFDGHAHAGECVGECALLDCPD
jgi:hypothetical protein